MREERISKCLSLQQKGHWVKGGHCESVEMGTMAESIVTPLAETLSSGSDEACGTVSPRLMVQDRDYDAMHDLHRHLTI